MALFASPLSFSITEEQLAWLDQRRRHGALSRSAALRQVIDATIAAEQGVRLSWPRSPPSVDLRRHPWQPM